MLTRDEFLHMLALVYEQIGVKEYGCKLMDHDAAQRKEIAVLKRAMKILLRTLDCNEWDSACCGHNFGDMAICPHAIETPPDSGKLYCKFKDLDNVDFELCWNDYIIAKATREVEAGK